MANCQTSIVPILEENLCPLGQFSTDCVIHQAAITYLGLPPNSTTTEVLAAYLLSLVDARNRIADLETNQVIPTYTVYRALLTQEGTSDPTATVKAGTTLTTGVTYDYQGVGTYQINFADPIITTTNYTVVQGAGTIFAAPIMQVYYNSPTQLLLITNDFLGMVGTPVPSNDLLDNHFIEITIDNA